MNEAGDKVIFWRQVHILQSDFHLSHSLLRAQCLTFKCTNKLGHTCLEHLLAFCVDLALNKQFVATKFFHQISNDDVRWGSTWVHELIYKLRLHINSPFSFCLSRLIFLNLHTCIRMSQQTSRRIFVLTKMRFWVITQVNVDFLNANLICLWLQGFKSSQLDLLNLFLVGQSLLNVLNLWCRVLFLSASLWHSLWLSNCFWFNNLFVRNALWTA